MNEQLPTGIEDALAPETALESHPLLRPLVAVLAALGFSSLIFSTLVSPSQESASALRGCGFICLGLAGCIAFGHAWWHRQPIRIKGGLSPDRPFFYHVGSALLFGTCLLLVVAGISSVRTWMVQ
jgi:hypothetical protein